MSGVRAGSPRSAIMAEEQGNETGKEEWGPLPWYLTHSRHRGQRACDPIAPTQPASWYHYKSNSFSASADSDIKARTYSDGFDRGPRDSKSSE